MSKSSEFDLVCCTHTQSPPGSILCETTTLYLNEKAFDSLNWDFVFNTLNNVNFGEQFIEYVRTMCTIVVSTEHNDDNTNQNVYAI